MSRADEIDAAIALLKDATEKGEIEQNRGGEWIPTAYSALNFEYVKYRAKRERREFWLLPIPTDFSEDAMPCIPVKNSSKPYSHNPNAMPWIKVREVRE